MLSSVSRDAASDWHRSSVGAIDPEDGGVEEKRRGDHEEVSCPELRALGAALLECSEAVLERVVELNCRAGVEIDPQADESVACVISLSTEAVARWMSGQGVATAREVGRGGWTILSQLAIQRTAPLNEITKRALRWRDATHAVLADLADERGTGDEVLEQAYRMLQRSLDVTLVRLCEAFENERSAIDEELARRQEELEYLATHDALTALPNRTLIVDRAEHLLACARRDGAVCAALFIDLDGFKDINDGLGHQAGDELLQSVCARLSGAIRESDTFGRLGGDEFIVLLKGAKHPDEPELVAQRIVDALAEPFALDAAPLSEISVTASIGIAAAEKGSAADLLREADIAMYQAKLAGKNRIATYGSDVVPVAETRAGRH